MGGRWKKSVPGKIKLSANSCGPLTEVEADFLGRGTGNRDFACLLLLEFFFVFVFVFHLEEWALTLVSQTNLLCLSKNIALTRNW